MALHETDVVIRLVGESGEGTVSLGELTVQMLAAMGLEVCTFQTFPSEIKGGTVMYQIRAKSGAILSLGDYADVVVALNASGFGLYGQVLRENGILLYDSDSYTPEHAPGRIEYALPMSEIAKAAKEAIRDEVPPEQLKRLPAPKNIVGLGALLRLLNAPMELVEQHLHSLFGRKGDVVVQMNMAALHQGVEYVAKQIAETRILPHVYAVDRAEAPMIVNGNQMIALGAIGGGLNFFAGYPITPATEIMEQLAKDLPAFGGELIQAEDEIAALGMAIGASFAGKRAMTSSSGPGMSLMVEGINLAGQAEIPVVIVDVQRGGASTGMPTKTSQGDLNLALYGVHNEQAKIVLAASTVEDCFWITVDAFNLAEAYQCPVIVLSDQSLATRKHTAPTPDLSKIQLVDRTAPVFTDQPYQRFENTDSGVSPMSWPGMANGAYTATGIEHDESGDPGYTPELAGRMRSKRFRKLETLRDTSAHEFTRFSGEEGAADVGVIGFGSTYGVLREATERAVGEGFKVAHMHLRMVNPLPTKQVQEFVARCKTILIPENNPSGQLGGWLRMNTDISFTSYCKDEGLPFIPNEIYLQIVELASRVPELASKV